MKTLLRLASVLTLIGLSACGSGGGDRADGPPGMIERGMNGRGNLVRGGLDANTVYSQAMDLRSKGDCKGASERLRFVAALGPGYENAQSALGDCLLRLAGFTDFSADYIEGLMWLRRAADAGWPEAQFDLAQSHLTGPALIRNHQEAAYWLALYDDNPEKARVGFVPPDQASVNALHAGLTAADLEAGKRRAAQWQKKLWIPPTPANGPGLTARGLQLQQQPQRSPYP